MAKKPMQPPRLLALLVLCAASACGSSSSSSSTQTQSPPQADPNDPAISGGMTIANSLRDEFMQLKADHEAAWQERINTATGPDLDTIGPRYASVSADFSTRADEAWQSMNTAVGYLQQNQLEPFRHFINEARGRVAVLRQMVEQIQAELAQMQAAAVVAPEPATESAAEPTAAP